jgi:hypothetical protein
MHPITPSLFQELPGYSRLKRIFMGYRRKETPHLLSQRFYRTLSLSRLQHIRNAYEGETAYVLTCGPSIQEIWNRELRQFLADKLVIAVKQTHDLLSEITDFHLFNRVRIKPYTYPGPTIRISVWEYMNENPAHIHFPLRSDQSWERSIIVSNEYKHYGNLMTEYDRPLGVGIMFEIGLFLPVHLGCRKIILMGFDMNAEGSYHFYRNDCSDSSAYARPGECEKAQSSVSHYHQWVQSLGIEVALYSPLSALPLPKIDRFDMLKEGGTPSADRPFSA